MLWSDTCPDGRRLFVFFGHFEEEGVSIDRDERWTAQSVIAFFFSFSFLSPLVSLSIRWLGPRLAPMMTGEKKTKNKRGTTTGNNNKKKSLRQTGYPKKRDDGDDDDDDADDRDEDESKSSGRTSQRSDGRHMARRGRRRKRR